VTTWLIDKSALVRLAESPDAAEWAARIERGLVRITTVTRLETGYSARSGPQMRAGFQRPPLSSMPVEYLTPAIEDRAVELLTLLADRGQHRAPSIPDLIIAATAELAGLTVLHLDKDFDLIAGITGQPIQRLTIDSAADMDDAAEQTEALSFPDSGGCGRSASPFRPSLGTSRAPRKSLYVTGRVLDVAAPSTVPPTSVHEPTPNVTYNRRWGGWGSNPRPADYEKYGFVHRTR
jgi:hypothetical protein